MVNVDDILITCNHSTKVTHAIDHLKQQFKMKELSYLSTFFGYTKCPKLYKVPPPSIILCS